MCSLWEMGLGFWKRRIQSRNEVGGRIGFGGFLLGI